MKILGGRRARTLTLFLVTGALAAFPVGAGASSVTWQEAVVAAGQPAPQLLTPAPAAPVGGVPLEPRLTSNGSGLTAQGTLTASEVSKDPADGFAVGTADGAINFNLTTLAPGASGPVLVNGVATLFANAQASTDLLVRPTAQGATAALILRASDAPTSFPIQLSIGPDQQLVALADGSVAVTDAAVAPPASAAALDANLAPAESAPGAFTDPLLLSDSDLFAPSPATAVADSGAGSSSTEDAATVGNDLAPSDVEPASSPDEPTEALAVPAVQEASAPLAAGTPTAADEALNAQAAVDGANAQTGSSTLLVLRAESLVDANGASVATSLSITGPDTVTLTVPSAGVAYPAAAAIRASAPTTAVAAAAKRAVRYGLAEENAERFAPVDPRLASDNGPLNIGFARRTRVRYNVAVDPAQAALLSGVVSWVTAVRQAHLTPYITLLLPDQKQEQGSDGPRLPTPAAYKAAVKSLMTKEGIKGKVKVWGAVNEPDLHQRASSPANISVLATKPGKAARYWVEAQSLANTNACSGCTVVAGEFDGERWADQQDYILKYGNALKRLVRTRPTVGMPRVWALHAYYDLVNSAPGDFSNPTTAAFTAFVKDYGHPRVWLSEQGAVLQTRRPPSVSDPNFPTPRHTRLFGHPARQRVAALDFLKLSSVDPSIDRVTYYDYQAPDPNDVRHQFDSSMVDFYGKARPAYCVLAFKNHPRTCSASSPPAVMRPEPIRGPAITGSFAAGSVLTADPGDWTGGITTFAFQWQRRALTGTASVWTDIAGATGATFTPGPDLDQSAVRVLVKPATPAPFEEWVRSDSGVVHLGGTTPTILVGATTDLPPQITILPGGLDTTVTWRSDCAGVDGDGHPTGCTQVSSPETVPGTYFSFSLGRFGPPDRDCFNPTIPFWVTAENTAGTTWTFVDAPLLCAT